MDLPQYFMIWGTERLDFPCAFGGEFLAEFFKQVFTDMQGLGGDVGANERDVFLPQFFFREEKG